MFGVSHGFSFFVFLKSIGIGYFLGILYAAFKLLRVMGLRQTAVVFLQDILFFIISAIVVFLFVFDTNAGVFRFYIISGILIGFLFLYSASDTFFSLFHRASDNNKTKRNKCRHRKK